jgi:hypothetical protein
LVLEALLQSPSFLYRLEKGTAGRAGDVVRLTQFEIASRLSYFLWQTGPDEALLRVASEGGLDTVEGIEDVAREMVADPRAAAVIRDFHHQWLGLDRWMESGSEHPAGVPAKSVMVEEVDRVVSDIIWPAENALDGVFQVETTYVDSSLALIYGVEVEASAGWVPISLPAGRAGLLTLPAVLAAHGTTSPPLYRGKFIRESLLCVPMPPPPDELIDPPATFEGQSDREKSEGRLAHSGCSGCHQLMDPMGLAFDNFDAYGREREADQHGNWVEDRGRIIGAGIADGEVGGAVEFGERLSQSDLVVRCYQEQWFQFAFARMNAVEDECTMHQIEQAVTRSGGDLPSLLVAMTTTDAFLYRRLEAEGI